MRTRLPAALALAVAAVAASAAPARADDVRSYRLQLATLDVTSDVILFGGLASENDLAIYAGATTYLLGGPILHATHDRWGRAGISLGLRVLAPVGFAYAGCALVGSDASDDGDRATDLGCLLGGGIGLAGGFLLAQLVDIAFLAGPSSDPSDPAPPARMFTLGGSF